MKRYEIILLAVIMLSCGPKTQTYDYIIKNGLIYDGSGGTPYIGDVGIIADTIAAIGIFKGKSKNIIDVEGKAV